MQHLLLTDVEYRRDIVRSPVIYVTYGYLHYDTFTYIHTHSLLTIQTSGNIGAENPRLRLYL